MKNSRRPLSAEQEWAEEFVRHLPLAQAASLDDLIDAVARRLGRPLIIVPIDQPVLNGALEDRPGNTVAIRIPSAATERHRRHLVCRGLVRALYREPGARHGHQDLHQPIDREIEYAAMALMRHLDQAAARQRPTTT